MLRNHNYYYTRYIITVTKRACKAGRLTWLCDIKLTNTKTWEGGREKRRAGLGPLDLLKVGKLRGATGYIGLLSDLGGREGWTRIGCRPGPRQPITVPEEKQAGIER